MKDERNAMRRFSLAALLCGVALAASSGSTDAVHHDVLIRGKEPGLPRSWVPSFEPNGEPLPRPPSSTAPGSKPRTLPSLSSPPLSASPRVHALLRPRVVRPLPCLASLPAPS